MTISGQAVAFLQLVLFYLQLKTNSSQETLTILAVS